MPTKRSQHLTIALFGLTVVQFTGTPVLASPDGPGGPGGDGSGGGGLPRTSWPTRAPSMTNADAYLSNSSDSIQDAIDDASHWDVIMLGPDTWWTPALDFDGKAIWLVGSEGTMLKGSGTLITTSGTASEAAKLRITNIDFQGQSPGSQSRAIHIEHTEVELIDCTFEDFDPRHSWDTDVAPLEDDGRGGAILSLESEMVLKRCEMSSCASDQGGALYHGTESTTQSSGPIGIEDCFISLCEADLQGGGLCVNGTMSMSGTTITSCTGTVGGGLFLTSKDGTSELKHSQFYHNSCVTTFGYGQSGGMHGWGYMKIQHCQFVGNKADKRGACSLSTLFSQSEDILIRDCMFSDSTSADGFWDFNFEGVSTHSGDVVMQRVRVEMTSPPTEYWSGSGANIGRNYVNDDGTMRDVTGMHIGDGGACPADLDQDGLLGVIELLDILSHWREESLIGDWNGDRELNSSDLTLMLLHWGDCLP